MLGQLRQSVGASAQDLRLCLASLASLWRPAAAAVLLPVSRLCAPAHYKMVQFCLSWCEFDSTPNKHAHAMHVSVILQYCVATGTIWPNLCSGHPGARVV